MYFILKKDGFEYHLLNKNKEVIINAKWIKKYQPYLGTNKLIQTLIVQNSDLSILSSSFIQPNNSFIHFSWNDKFIVNIDCHMHVISCVNFWQNIWEMNLGCSKFRYQSKFWNEQVTIHRDNTPILKINNEIIFLNEQELSLTDLQIGLTIYLTIKNPWQVSEIDL